jgi:hypothetical protein
MNPTHDGIAWDSAADSRFGRQPVLKVLMAPSKSSSPPVS